MKKMQWNEELYNLLALPYWASNTIGKQKNPNSNIKNWHDCYKSLKKEEAVLNSHLNLVFSLLPANIISRILSKMLENKITDNFEYSSDYTGTFVESVGQFTDPDLLLEGEKNLVCIEMKSRKETKCHMEQFLKYIFLQPEYEKFTGKKFKYHLIFLGVSSFDEFFREKFNSISELVYSAERCVLPSKSKKGNIDLSAHHEYFKEILKNINISYLDYKDLSDIFLEEINITNCVTQKKLFQGLINELKSRKLI